MSYDIFEWPLTNTHTSFDFGENDYCAYLLMDLYERIEHGLKYIHAKQ